VEATDFFTSPLARTVSWNPGVVENFREKGLEMTDRGENRVSKLFFFYSFATLTSERYFQYLASDSKYMPSFSSSPLSPFFPFHSHLPCPSLFLSPCRCNVPRRMNKRDIGVWLLRMPDKIQKKR
jgi:hypothetical protein